MIKISLFWQELKEQFLNKPIHQSQTRNKLSHEKIEALKKVHDERITAQAKVWDELFNCLKQVAPDLLEDETEGKTTPEIITKIEGHLKSRLPKEWKKALDYLSAGLIIGQRTLGWTGPLPTAHHTVPDERNLFTPDNFTGHIELAKFEDAFLKSLATPTSKPDILLAQALCSAVIYGGLHQQCWVAPWLAAVSTGVTCWGKWLWLDLRREAMASEGRYRPIWLQYRRWVADPLSQVLILRWTHKSRNDQENTTSTAVQLVPDDLFKRMIEEKYRPKVTQPGSFSQLLSLAANRSAILKPGLFSGYERGSIQGVSLTEPTIVRVLTGTTIPVEAIETAKHSTFKVILKHKNYSKSQNLDIDFEHYDTLLAILAPGEDGKVPGITSVRTAIEKYLLEHGDKFSPMAWHVLKWVERLLHPTSSALLEHRQGKALAFTTVQSYLNLIGRQLIASAEGLDYAELYLWDFELIYEEVLEFPATVAAKVRTTDRLEQFHGFLKSSDRRIPEVDFDEMRCCLGIPAKNVRANLLSPKEYHAILNKLGGIRDHLTRWQRIHIITTILAFRCGLRRGEIQKLKLNSLVNVVTPELRISPNRYGSLKSRAANRRLPLSNLLTKEELNFIEKWIRLRSAQGSGCELLLVHPDCGQKPIPPELLFNPVVEAARNVTQDHTISMHTFRHSFVSWNFLRLACQGKDVTDLFGSRVHDFWFEPASIRGFVLDLMETQDKGISSLFALSMLTGHADIPTTIRNYTHLLDLAHGILNRRLFYLPEKELFSARSLRNIGNVQYAWSFKLRKNSSDTNELLERLATSYKSIPSCLVKTLPQGEESKPDKPQKRTEPRRPDWDQVLANYLEYGHEKLHEPHAAHVLPRVKAELDFSRGLYENLYCLKWQQAAFVEKVMHSVYKSYILKSGGFSVKDAKFARKFCRAIRLLDVSTKQIAIEHNAKPGQGELEKVRYRDYWTGIFGLVRQQCTGGTTAGKDCNKRGEIVVTVCEQSLVAPDAESAAASYGFRFFISLIYFIHIEKSASSAMSDHHPLDQSNDE